MPEYQLYCMAQSGNAYRAALMLSLIGADWKPIFVDFFKAGETRKPKYREKVNEMGELPVLAHGAKKLSQSGVILTYLANRSGKFKPDAGEDAQLEALRWIIFDNQKINGFLGPYRFLKNFARPAGDPGAMNFLKVRIDAVSRFSTSGLANRPSCSATGRPSSTFRVAAICIIRPKSSASTSPPSIRISARGSAGSKRYRAGGIPMT